MTMQVTTLPNTPVTKIMTQTRVIGKTSFSGRYFGPQIDFTQSDSLRFIRSVILSMIKRYLPENSILRAFHQPNRSLFPVSSVAGQQCRCIDRIIHSLYLAIPRNYVSWIWWLVSSFLNNHYFPLDKILISSKAHRNLTHSIVSSVPDTSIRISREH